MEEHSAATVEAWFGQNLLSPEKAVRDQWHSIVLAACYIAAAVAAGVLSGDVSIEAVMFCFIGVAELKRFFAIRRDQERFTALKRLLLQKGAMMEAPCAPPGPAPGRILARGILENRMLFLIAATLLAGFLLVNRLFGG